MKLQKLRFVFLLVMQFTWRPPYLLAQEQGASEKENITVEQYSGFLKTVAANDTHHLYEEANKQIGRLGESGNYHYEIVHSEPNETMLFLSWFDAARYCNWKNNKTNACHDHELIEHGTYGLKGEQLLSINAQEPYLLQPSFKELARTFHTSQPVTCSKLMNTALSSNFDQSGMYSYSPDQNSSSALSHQLFPSPRCEKYEMFGLGQIDFFLKSNLLTFRLVNTTAIAHQAGEPEVAVADALLDEVLEEYLTVIFMALGIGASGHLGSVEEHQFNTAGVLHRPAILNDALRTKREQSSFSMGITEEAPLPTQTFEVQSQCAEAIEEPLLANQNRKELKKGAGFLEKETFDLLPKLNRGSLKDSNNDFQKIEEQDREKLNDDYHQYLSALEKATATLQRTSPESALTEEYSPQSKNQELRKNLADDYHEYLSAVEKATAALQRISAENEH